MAAGEVAASRGVAGAVAASKAFRMCADATVEAATWPDAVTFKRRPDDFHLHLRDGASLKALGKYWNKLPRRAIIMPNLKPPVTTTKDAEAYRSRILEAIPGDADFEPLMTLYLTDRTTPEEIERAVESGIVYGVKLYPAGATTNSDSGVTDISLVWKTLERMAALGLPLCVHGEVTNRAVDVFAREKAFVDGILAEIVDHVPDLRVIVEHVTTRAAVEFVRSKGDNVAATITPQHLLFNRNALFDGGLRPHLYCLPVLKKEDDRAALLEAIRDDSGKFFLGTDSAPHPRGGKESPCGCAGVFSSPTFLESYAIAFEREGIAPDVFERFACEYGAKFYKLPLNDPSKGTVTLQRKPQVVPEELPFGEGEGAPVVVPLLAGATIPWTASLS